MTAGGGRPAALPAGPNGLGKAILLLVPLVGCMGLAAVLTLAGALLRAGGEADDRPPPRVGPDVLVMAPSTGPTTGPEEVLARLEAGGLDVGAVRDDTALRCGPEAEDCTRWTTSDLVSVVVWVDPDGAAAWAAGQQPDGRLVPPRTTVHLTVGVDQLPAGDQARYEGVVAEIVRDAGG